MPESSRRPRADAAALGAVSGLRTFTGPAVLALRGRLGHGAARRLLIAAAAGELVGDKLPLMPFRSDPPSLIARLGSGATVGRAVAGAGGAGVGAAGAAATTYLSERLRAAVGQRTGIPDPLVGVSEDALVLGVAVLATRTAGQATATASATAAASATATAAAPGPDDEPPRPSRWGAVARGVAAGAVGTAAMTSAQIAYLKATGGEPSSAPGEVGRRLIEGVAGRRVPRRHRDALNQGVHAVYGTSWGLPFGLVAGSLPGRPPAPVSGVALGLTAWGVSLIGLPALNLAPALWQQSPAALASDLGFHLVYGVATATAYRALGG